jgi:hypothetical protein
VYGVNSKPEVHYIAQNVDGCKLIFFDRQVCGRGESLIQKNIGREENKKISAGTRNFSEMVLAGFYGLDTIRKVSYDALFAGYQSAVGGWGVRSQ